MLIVSIPTYSAGISKKLLYEINYKDLSGYSDNKLPAGVIQNIQVGTANLAGNSFALVFNSYNPPINPVSDSETFNIWLNIIDTKGNIISHEMVPTVPLYLIDNNSNTFNYSQSNSPIVVKTFSTLPNKIFMNIRGTNGLAINAETFVYRLIVDLGVSTNNANRWTVISKNNTSTTGTAFPNQFLNHTISDGVPLLFYLEDPVNKKMSVYSIK
jgi:hypothetical protein